MRRGARRWGGGSVDESSAWAQQRRPHLATALAVNNADYASDDERHNNPPNSRRHPGCCAAPSPYGRAALSDAKNAFYKIADYDHESKKIVKLMVPFTIGETVEAVFEGVSLAIVSWHLGTDALAAYAIADIFMEFTGEMLGGFIDAQGVLCTHAVGAGNFLLAGQYVQLSQIVWLVSNIPFVFIHSYFTYNILIWLDLSPEIATMGQEFVIIAVWTDIVEGIGDTLFELLEVTDREAFSAVIDVAGNATESLLIFATLHYYEGSTLRTVALVELLVTLVFLIGSVVFMTRRGWLDLFWDGMVHTFALRNRLALSQLIKTGIPLAFGAIIAEGEWELLTIFASHMGSAEVATWAILGTVWDIFEASTEGISDAGEVRCAYHLGRGNPEMAKMSAYKSLYIGTTFSVFATAIFFMLGDDIPRWFTSDLTLQKMMRELIPLIGVGNITMSFGMVCWALVGAQGRYRLATFVALSCSWTVTVPLAALFVYGLGIDLQGLTAAVVVGYSVTGTALSYVLLRSNWDKLTDNVQRLNFEMGEVVSDDSDSDDSSSEGGYNSMDWVKLPRDVRRAAETLGFTKLIWDVDGKGPLDDKDWDKLTIEQQRAAVIIGYDKEKWENEGDSSTESGFSGMDWAELPADVLQAAETLGYTKKIWNTSGAKAPIDAKDWKDLTAEEQRAAIVIGYDADEWDSDDDSSSSSSSSGFSSMGWDELPSDARRAAETLGYTKSTWGNNGKAASHKDWKDLTREENIAAIVLGYDEEKWNGGDDSSSSSSNSSGGFSSIDWDELPADARQAAETLGYDRYVWDCNGRVPADDKDWEELNSKERFAAIVLGYDDESWNGKPMKFVTIL